MIYSFLNYFGEEEVGCGKGRKNVQIEYSTVLQATEYDDERKRVMDACHDDTILRCAYINAG